MGYSAKKLFSVFFYLLLFLVFFSHIPLVSAATPEYGRSFRYADDSRPLGSLRIQQVVSDTVGSVYHVGYFNGSIDLDPTSGVDLYNNYYAVPSGDTSATGYLSKINADGSYNKSYVFAPQDYQSVTEPNAMVLDSSNNMYVAGRFRGTVDFDPTAGVDLKTSAGGQDSFLVKINSDGSYGYGYVIGNSDDSRSFSLAVDGNDNVYELGEFFGTADLDPTGGTDTQVGSSTGNHYPAYITKINADGTYAYSLVYDELGDGAQAIRIDTDTNNNLYMMSYANGTIDLDPTGGTDSHTLDTSQPFIAEFTSAGAYIQSFITTKGTTFGLDSNNNLFYTGFLADATIDLDPTAGTDSYSGLPPGDVRMYVTKINSDGTYGYSKVWQQYNVLVLTQGIQFDSSDNIYLNGYFSSTVNFDPTGGTDNHASNGQNDIFITKLNSDGSYNFTQTFGSAESEQTSIFPLAVYSNGNILVTGQYAGTMDFNPGGGTDVKRSFFNNEYYLIKINSDQTYGYGYVFRDPTESGSSYLSTITTDSAGNFYTAGQTFGKMDFDLTSGSDVQVNSIAAGRFVSKYKADGTYAFTYLYPSDISINKVAADSNNNLYFWGSFSNTVDFDPTGGTDNHTGSNTPFLTKINSDGSYGWTYELASSLSLVALLSDSSANLYLLGNFSSSADMDPTGGTDTVAPVGSTDTFITKLTSAGAYASTWVVNSATGSDSNQVQSATMDSSNNIYLSGALNGTVDLNPFGGTDNHTSAGNNDVFLTKISTSGTYGYGYTFGDTNSDSSVAINTDSLGNVYLGAQIDGTVDFDPTGGTDSQAAGTASLIKINSDGTYAYAKQYNDDFNLAGVATDSLGNIYLNGYFSGTVDFDPSGAVDNMTESTGNGTGFISKLTSTGVYDTTYTFTLSGDADVDYMYVDQPITIDSEDNLYMMGEMGGTVDLDPFSTTDIETITDEYFAIKLVLSPAGAPEDDGSSSSSPTPTSSTPTNSTETTAPVITNLIATSTATSITVSWTTNEDATSTVFYGTTTTYSSSTLNNSMTKNHTAVINLLQPGTNYHLKVLSADGNNNQIQSADFVVRTLGSGNSGSGIGSVSGGNNSNSSNSESADEQAGGGLTESPNPTPKPTIISNVQVQVDSPTQVTITWTTSNPTSSQVDYGTSSQLGEKVFDPTQTTTHSITLDNLVPNTDYSFQVVSDGDTTSVDDFKTLKKEDGQNPLVQFGQAMGGIFSSVGDGFSQVAKSNVIASLTNFLSNPATQIVGEISIAAAATFVFIQSSLQGFNLLTLLQDIPLYLTRSFFLFLQFLGLKKKDKPWGVVYDSLNKQPIDPAIVTLFRINADGTKKMVDTRITDFEGRFGFLVEKGQYQIAVRKDDYQFPSTIMKGAAADFDRLNLYFGQTITISEPSDVINVSIPMDQKSFNWNQAAKPIQYKPTHFYATENFLFGLSLIGLMISILIFAAHTSLVNGAFLVVNILVFSLRFLPRKVKKWGVVYDKATGKVLPMVAVKSVRTGVTTGMCTTNSMGRYFLILNEGEHTLQVEKDGQILGKIGPITVKKDKVVTCPDIAI